MNFKSIKISKQIELAIRWLIYLAQTDKLKFVSLRSFCDQTKTSFYYLQKINRALIKKSLLLIRDKKLSQKIGKKGQKLVLEKYTWEKSAQALEEVYRETIRRK